MAGWKWTWPRPWHRLGRRGDADPTAMLAEIEGEFDENAYLAANPDVGGAVAQGQFRSGLDHYAKHGRREGRPLGLDRPRPPPPLVPQKPGEHWTRRDKILAELDLSRASGLEIGALNAPIVTREEGRIFYVDHLDTENLRRKYAVDPTIDPSRIVTVDGVWGSSTLRESVGPDRSFDFVVASHVAEHVPDLVTWLSEVRGVVAPAGSLRLALPDRRVTFDCFRVESRLHDAVDAYLRRARVPLPRVIFEHFHLFADGEDQRAWREGRLTAAPHRKPEDLQAILAKARDALESGSYHDTHCWVFTPHSFATLCDQLAQLSLIGFRCERWFETAPGEIEFIVWLAPSDDAAAIRASWQAMRAATAR